MHRTHHYLLEIAPTRAGVEALADVRTWLRDEVGRLGGVLESAEYALNRNDVVVELRLDDESLLALLTEEAEAQGEFRVVSASPLVPLSELEAHAQAPFLEPFDLNPDDSGDRPPDFFQVALTAFQHLRDAGEALTAVRSLPGVRLLKVEQLDPGWVLLHGSYTGAIPLATRLRLLPPLGARIELVVAPAWQEAIAAHTASTRPKDSTRWHEELLHSTELYPLGATV